MFRHQGKRRTFSHNLQIATVLSFVAGIVNVTGFLAIHQLTTNVTGHFAQFMYDVENFEFWKGTAYLLYIISFLLGSFSSSFLIEIFRENKKMNVFVIPTLAQVILLISAAIIGNLTNMAYPNLLACLLLFSMGMQNSYVTKISNAVVRTTHLTGLFTDLGIELSQLFFPKTHRNQKQISSNLKLRIRIISFFFLGGMVGGFSYSNLGFKINNLLIAAGVLLISLFYDDFKFHVIKKSRKRKDKKRLII